MSPDQIIKIQNAQRAAALQAMQSKSKYTVIGYMDSSIVSFHYVTGECKIY